MYEQQLDVFFSFLMKEINDHNIYYSLGRSTLF